MDELCERGYNCVRIDAFPHLVAETPHSDGREEFTILPEPYPGLFMSNFARDRIFLYFQSVGAVFRVLRQRRSDYWRNS
ncbi:MAG: hypothetical protein JRI97_02315, partial [Deltaproteobacteria bacterium]|nr:hypothetical protein [Deltaproteobacteria bacterium]